MEKSINEKEQCVQTDVKCRFFAQYWGQKLVAHTEDLKVDGIKELRYEPRTVINFKEIETSCLVLKSLSKITDKDAISMYRGLERNYESANQFLEDYKSIGFLEQGEVDFLRSNGYAVPFMNYSVDDLVSFGWVRLV